MTRIIYIANARMPTEKAHGYQMVQMCEAFAENGQDVILVAPRRINDQPELRHVKDIWAYYGVQKNFRLVALPCIDLIWLWSSKASFLLQTVTFLVSLRLWLVFQRGDVYFSRDHFVMAALAMTAPRYKLWYEVHSKFRSARGQALQKWLLRRVGKVISLTGTMAKQLEAMGAQQVIVAHDGIQPARFAELPPQAEIRAQIGIPANAFVACYAGRLHTMNMSKGLDLVVRAAVNVPDMVFLLVGGPDSYVMQLRELWQSLGLPPQNFVAVGTVPPTEVPRYLIAADVCLITSPKNEFFANETSPMKLFEYMMAGRAIIASDLPSTREVVAHGESAYLIPPSEVDALAKALQTLRDDPALRQKLGQQAKQIVARYTWVGRAQHILTAP